jgi:hypothetical protein
MFPEYNKILASEFAYLTMSLTSEDANLNGTLTDLFKNLVPYPLF